MVINDSHVFTTDFDFSVSYIFIICPTCETKAFGKISRIVILYLNVFSRRKIVKQFPHWLQNIFQGPTRFSHTWLKSPLYNMESTNSYIFKNGKSFTFLFILDCSHPRYPSIPRLIIDSFLNALIVLCILSNTLSASGRSKNTESRHLIFTWFDWSHQYQYLAAPRPTLGHYRGKSVLTDVNHCVFYQFWPELHWESRNEVGFLSPARRLWGLDQKPLKPFSYNYNALTH